MARSVTVTIIKPRLEQRLCEWWSGCERLALWERDQGGVLVPHSTQALCAGHANYIAPLPVRFYSRRWRRLGTPQPKVWAKRLATCENCGRTFLASAGRSTCCCVPKESEGK